MDQENALDIVREQDMRKRMEGGNSMVNYLSEQAQDLTWTNIDKIVDALGKQWVSSSNHKVALLGLDILNLLLGCIQKDFHYYYHLIQNHLVDRLGDQKDQVRDASITLLCNIMQASSTPQEIFDQIVPAFSHKVFRVRESICRLLVATINRFGARSLILSRLIPHVCKLVTDSNVQVRSTAEFTLGEIYRHVGEKVRQDVCKKDLPQNKLIALNTRFDAIRDSGEMNDGGDSELVLMRSASFQQQMIDSDGGDSVRSNNFIPRCATTHHKSSTLHRPKPSARSVSNATENPPSTRTLSTAPPSSKRTTTATRTVKSGVGSRSNAGGLDEDSFQNDFTTNLPSIRIFSGKDVSEQMQSVYALISDERKDWEVRTKALKQLRAIVVAGGTEYDVFYTELRQMEAALQNNTKDLRSQVVRETCVTVGFLSYSLKNQFEHCARTLLPALFTLIPNSAKVMSTSGILAIRTILRNTHNTRIIPTVVDHCTSKSVQIRKHTFSFIAIILQIWSFNLLEKNTAALKDSITKGIHDADAESREESRNAWHSFSRHFPHDADDIFQKLTANQQKLLKGSSSNVPGSSSSESLIDSSSKRSFVPPKPVSSRRMGPSRAKPLHQQHTAQSQYALNRSRSDIDSSSVMRSKNKIRSSGYNTIGRSAAAGRTAVSARPNLPIPPPHTTPGRQLQQVGRGLSSTPAGGIPKRARRSRTMEIGESSIPSHPGSRQTSPNSRRLARIGLTPSTRTPHRAPVTKSSSGIDSTPSKIPISRSRISSRINSLSGTPDHSRDTSRANSPTRYRGRTSLSTPMRVLPKGKEGEQALNNALLKKNRRDYSDLDDDYSDTSSVCSDRSYSRKVGLKKRGGVTSSLVYGGSDDIGDVLHSCESNSWTERKEGLSNLHSLIVQQAEFTSLQLKKILEIFNKMFADPHGKVFSMFLEMLPDFIPNYSSQLNEWLYCLMTQLLKKMGADLLGSVQTKVMNALRVTRESFPPQLQFSILSRYMSDPSQRPNLKVKVALLHYLLELTKLMKSDDLHNNAETRMAIPRIITWTTEPKSGDVRKIAEALLIKLFELNVVTFTAVIQNVPKTFKEGAMKILHGFMQQSIPDYHQQVVTSPASNFNSSYNSPSFDDRHNMAINSSNDFVNSSVSPHQLNTTSGGDSTLVHDDTLISQQTISDEVRELTSSIQKLRTPTTPKTATASIASLNNKFFSPALDDSNASRISAYSSPRQLAEYSPSAYTATMSPNNVEHRRSMSSSSNKADDNLVEKVARLVSMGEENADKLSNQLNQLHNAMKMSHHMETYANQWKHHFRSILYGLFEILRSDQESKVLVAALSILRELISKFSDDDLLTDQIEITLTHLINAHERENREVNREAESALSSLIQTVEPTLVIKTLVPILESQTNESDIKEYCLTKLDVVLRRCQAGQLTSEIVDSIMPCILQCYFSQRSNTRKVSCFCLVSLHRVIGNEELSPRLQSLPAGKLKLLQLYIKKQQNGT